MMTVLWLSHFTVSSSGETYNPTVTYVVNITVRRGGEVPGSGILLRVNGVITLALSGTGTGTGTRTRTMGTYIVGPYPCSGAV